MRFRLAIGIAALSAAMVLLMSGLVMAQGEGCSECAPDSNWVGQCPAGLDEIADHAALVGVSFDPESCDDPLNLIMLPCDGSVLIVSRSDPFPALINGGDCIDTEIIQMCLAGGGFTLVAGGGQGQGPWGGFLQQSLGRICELPGDPYLADSFFDVFFEVEYMGTYLYNHTPLTLEAVIHCVPPEAETYIHVQECVPLWTHPHPDSGLHVANLVSADHSVNCNGPSANNPTTWGGIKSLYR